MSEYRSPRSRTTRTTSMFSFSPSSRSTATPPASPTTLLSPGKRYRGAEEDEEERGTSGTESDEGGRGEKSSGSSSSGSDGESSESGEDGRHRPRREDDEDGSQSSFGGIVVILAFLLVVSVGVAIYLGLQDGSSDQLAGSNTLGAGDMTGGGAGEGGTRTTTSSSRSRSADESRTTARPSGKDPTKHSSDGTSKPTSSSRSDEPSDDPQPTRSPEAEGENKASDQGDDNTTDSPPATETNEGDDPKPTASSPSPSSDDPFINGCLKAHNDFRATHHADPLEWDQELADFAANWVGGCEFKHSGGPYVAGNAPYDPNTAYDPAGGIGGWNNEEKDYTYNPSSGFAMNTGHFTQVVWKDSKFLGCAVKACPGFLTSGDKYGAIMACEYKPAGNMGGAYEQNVQAP